MKRLRCLLWLLPCLLAAGAHAAIRVTDDRGHAVEFAQPVQRVVTLLPSLTETVCELQACERLVGVDRYSNWPARIKGLPQLGGLDDAQVERIVTLKPDVVLAATSARVVDRLEGLGIKVLALEAKTHADTRRVLESVAQVLGKPGEGEALWARIDQRIQAAAARVPANVRGQRVYFEVGEGPYAAGEVSFVGETLLRLGLRNVVSAALGPFPKLNPEFIVRAEPDIAMAPLRSVAEMPRRPGWAALQMVKNRRLCGFANDTYDVLVRPGPRLGEAAELMAACVAPWTTNPR
jgi:iron complex transport system substrate-binding protein